MGGWLSGLKRAVANRLRRANPGAAGSNPAPPVEVSAPSAPKRRRTVRPPQIECSSGKRRYENQGTAKAAVTRRGPSKKKGLRSYHCRSCGGWHLTSMRTKWEPKRGQR